MKALFVIIALLVGTGGWAFFMLATYDPWAGKELTDLRNVDSWKPTTEQIRAQLNSIADEQERKRTYGQLIRRRYRDRQMPVNLRVDSKGVFYLECGATIPNWDKAVAARQVWLEIHELFGKKQPIRIYESYISTASRFVGWVHESPHSPDKPEVVFDTGWHLRRPMEQTDYLRRLP